MCEYCEPWHDPKPLVVTTRLIVSLRVMDDMNRYCQVLERRRRKWRRLALEPVDKCPICGKDV